MCCSLRPAKLTNTVLYAGEAVHDGRRVHVMGYQNRAENLSKGANAMLLPIPSSATMGPDNMLDTTAVKHILQRFLATRVVGREYKGTSLKNGDFIGSATALGAANISRVPPPGA